MSDASEVKRLWIKNEDGLVGVFNVRKHVLDYKPEGFDEKTPLGPRYIEVMRAEDHERIVANKDAEIEKLQRKLEGQWKRNGKLVLDIAKQEKVIEMLKSSISLAISKLGEYHETYLDYDRPEMTAVPMEDDLLGIKYHLEGTLMPESELEAIERGEE